MSNEHAVTIWVGTRKGAFALRSGADRSTFTIHGPQLLGCEVYHVVQDPRDPSHLMMATKTGHLGPTVYHSADRGETWVQSTHPPQLPKEGEGAQSVNRVFWVEPGHASEPGVWWAGADLRGPQDPGGLGGFPCHVALFRSADGGATWAEAPGLRAHLSALENKDMVLGFSPGGAMLHSICVDPRDARRLIVSISGGGTLESRDGGETWSPLNKGVAMSFMPEGDYDYGHDPHCLTQHPANPDRLYQQNHCGIYRLDRPGDRWVRIGDNMPKDIGDIGFPIVPHPRDQDTVWVFPMDGGTVWPRTSPHGKPAVYRTRDAGLTWERQDAGLPHQDAYWTVLRQSMTADGGDPVGLYLGTTSGEVWASSSEGASWRPIAQHLPAIMSVTVAI